MDPPDAAPASDTEKVPDVEKSIAALYTLVNASLGRFGKLEVAADLMKIDRGDLRRALDGNGRYLAVDHVMRFGARVREHSTEATQRIAVAFVGPMDLLVFPRVQMTAAEKVRRYEAQFRRMPCGEEIMRDALETP